MKVELKKFPNYYITESGVIYDRDNNVVNTFINSIGYVSAILNGRIVTVAYLVANTFIPNNNKCIIVGYKDHDFTNLNVSNLYWYYSGEFELQRDELKEKKEAAFDYENDKQLADLFLKIDRDNNIIKEYDTTVEIKKEVGKDMNYYIYNKLFVSELNCYFVSAIDYFNSDNLAEELNELDEEMKLRKTILKLDYQGNIIREYQSLKEVAKDIRFSYDLTRGILEGDDYQREDYYLIYKKDYTDNTILFRLQSELKKKADRIRLREEAKQAKEDERNRIREEKKLERERIKAAKTEERNRIKEQKKIEKQRLKELKEAAKRNEAKPKKEHKPIEQYSLDGKLVQTYNSIRELKEQHTDWSYQNIYGCLKGKVQTMYGYRFIYKGEELKPIEFKSIIVEVNKDGNVVAEYISAIEAEETIGIKKANLLYYIKKKKILRDRNTVLIKKILFDIDLFEREYKPLFDKVVRK